MDERAPFTESAIMPCDWPNTIFHADVVALCRRYGYDPNDVAWIEFEVIDAPLLRFCIFLVNDEGRRYLDPKIDGAARRLAEHLLEGPLPPWWQPQMKVSS